MGLPRELPERLVGGWKKQMVMHLNYGYGHGAATYKIFDPEGQEMPFGFGYDENRKEQVYKRGFMLPGVEHFLTWEELRGLWPAYLEKEEERRLLESLDD